MTHYFRMAIYTHFKLIEERNVLEMYYDYKAVDGSSFTFTTTTFVPFRNYSYGRPATHTINIIYSKWFPEIAYSISKYQELEGSFIVFSISSPALILCFCLSIFFTTKIYAFDKKLKEGWQS